jgi:hypothetical protein
MLRFGDPERMVKLFEFGIVFNRFADQAKTLSAAAFNDRGEQETIEEAPERIGIAKLEQCFDIGIFLHFFGKGDAAFGHVSVDLLEMLQLFHARFDQFGNDFDAVGIFGDEAHGHGRSFALAIGVVLEKSRKIGHD